MSHRQSFCAFLIALLALFAPVTLAADQPADEPTIVEEIAEYILSIFIGDGDGDEFGPIIPPS